MEFQQQHLQIGFQTASESLVAGSCSTKSEISYEVQVSSADTSTCKAHRVGHVGVWKTEELHSQTAHIGRLIYLPLLD